MLVLSRDRDEEIYITDVSNTALNHIRLTVVNIRGDKVRIGLSATPDNNYSVDRSEFLRINWPALYRAIRSKEKNKGRGEVYDPEVLEQLQEMKDVLNSRFARLTNPQQRRGVR